MKGAIGFRLPWPGLSKRWRAAISVSSVIALGVLSATPPAAPVAVATVPTAAGPWLDHLNEWRAALGVSALTENATWSQGDYSHALYMVKNDLVTHYETPGVPYYTAAGDTAAKASNLNVSSTTATTDTQAIDWWMGAPFHSMALMDPRLASTGFGSYRQVKSGWQMGAAVDVVRGNPFTGGRFPVFFPGDGSTEPLTRYSGHEFPDPLQACSGYTLPAGLPLYVEVGGNVATTAGTIHSLTANGVPVEHCVIDSRNAALGSYLKMRGGVIVVPKAPLQNGVNYVVSVTVNGAPYTWSFTVGPLNPSGYVWSAAIDMTAVPGTWIKGVAQTFNVAVTNNGNVTWVSTGYEKVDLGLHFASSPGGSANMAHWLSSNAFSLPADLAPGATATVSVTLTPGFFGHVYLEALMVREHRFWFDAVTRSPVQWAAKPVYVANVSWKAGINTTTFPTTWTKGVSRTFSVTVTNTGNVTWPGSGTNPVMLNIHFASYAGGTANMAYWLTSNSFRLPGDVAPGASATVTVTVTPNFFGHVVLEGEMFKNQQFWFDKVTASPAQWAYVPVLVTQA